MKILYLHRVQVVYSISSKTETFNCHEVEHELNPIDQKVSDGIHHLKFGKKKKKKKNGKLDIKFKSYYYKHFVFIRP